MTRTEEYFKEGHVYNFCYFGDNEAYKKQNGQTTRCITKIEPNGKIELVDLFTCYLSKVKSPLLEGNTCYWTMKYMLKSQHEYTITEVMDEKDYFKHSVRMSVFEAVQKKLVTKDAIQHVFRNQSKDFIRENPVVCHSNWYINEPNYFSLRLSAQQGISENKYLQTIVFVWNSQEEMQEDVKSVFPKAWFM